MVTKNSVVIYFNGCIAEVTPRDIVLVCVECACVLDYRNQSPKVKKGLECRCMRTMCSKHIATWESMWQV